MEILVSLSLLFSIFYMLLSLKLNEIRSEGKGICRRDGGPRHFPVLGAPPFLR